MSKIFISHSTLDGNFATRLMDMLQNQFNLKRSNFFLTSDEELEVGDNWIEEIRKGMEDANIIMPLITLNYLESQFCLCELGAAWVNQKALVPVIIPPLDHHALDSTPYRSWVQAITLNSVKDLQRLAEAMKRKEVGNINIVRFTNRAENFYNEILSSFVKEMGQRETITVEVMKTLKLEIEEYKSAYQEAEKELDQMKKKNDALRKMKDASEVKAFEYAQMDEWETFMDAVKKAEEQLKKLPNLVISIFYHDRQNNQVGGYIGEQYDNSELNALKNKGYIEWDDGWSPDYDHPAISRADNALNHLSTVIKDLRDSEQFCERFEEEYNEVRLSLVYSPFWDEVLGTSIQHSAS
ncbi:MAG: toll/interleukin-1 receptor domain-containing protein [Desulfosporosinus sp.]|nr:toll/interleukin-1 receptor domain-containing protein [Desulfosporosinus sp.]